jgi:hypothetical protein
MITLGAIESLSRHCKTEDEAKEIVNMIILETEKTWPGKYTADQAENIALSNIGYVTGYMNVNDADRVLALFKTEHPIFKGRHPEPEEAFMLGLAMANGAFDLDLPGSLVITPEYIALHGGKWIEADSHRLRKLFPHKPPIICGSAWPSVLPHAYCSSCALCAGLMALSSRDKPALDANPDMVKLCQECFLKLLADSDEEIIAGK